MGNGRDANFLMDKWISHFDILANYVPYHIFQENNQAKAKDFTTLHILRDCNYANNIWKKLINPSKVANFYSSCLRDWMRMNLTGKIENHLDFDWVTTWAVIVWKLWI